MGTPLKLLVGLALVLPMLAYVAGALAASSHDEPGRREPVILRDAPGPSAPESPGGRPAHRDDAENSVDDNGVRVVSPEPTRVGGGDGHDLGDDGQRPERDDDDSRDGGADTDADDDSDDGGGDD